ncbi:MAG: hypothetical protein HY903_02265 [Deltaproteobacteria bacterium]|nr:hypothetical protein [Deltaproteobacteria bacterium]
MTAEEFPAVRATWTRSAKVYQGLESKLFVTATLHAPEFRRAFPVAFPEIYGQGGELTRRELVDLSGDVESFFTFFVAAFTPVTKWNDFANESSIWRLTLIGSEEIAVGPAAILPIKVDENVRAVYPYIGHFDKCYLVRFPLTDPMSRPVITEKTRGVTLRIASALGVAELVWALQLPEGGAAAVEPPPAREPHGTRDGGAPQETGANGSERAP